MGSLSFDGMSLRMYLIAHAPAEPQAWFLPVMPTERPEPIWSDEESRMRDASALNFEAMVAWDVEHKKQRYIQWPAAWADEILKGQE